MDGEFPASLDNLHQMLTWITTKAGVIDFTPETLQRIELASEEAIVNIIQHGYQGTQGYIWISCRPVNPDTIEIILKDNGVPHNPLLNIQEPDHSLEKTGGHGMRLIVSLMDKVTYQREQDTNILIILKKADSKLMYLTCFSE
ncbi:MAG: ATP-binding protein [Parachlamydiaceae bacterium]